MATTQKWSAWRRRPPLSIVMAYFAGHAADHAARFSEVWPGALVAGLSVELLNLAFPIYLHLTRGAATYGRSFGFLFVVGTWTYLLSMVLLLGAVINRMRFDRGRLEGQGPMTKWPTT
jgi:uncharacterized BrkB/YihY/UPF0761 family membrane protein